MTSPDRTHRGEPQPEAVADRDDTERRDEKGRRLSGGRSDNGRPAHEPGTGDDSIAEEAIDYFTFSGDADSPASDADAPPPG
ncbi:MAG: hypothetical protein AB7L13_15200 [Acidimicrobiia bacterium]